MHRGTFKRTHTRDCTYFTNCWRPTSASQQCLLLETVCTTQKYLFFFTVFCTKHRQYREGQALQLAAKITWEMQKPMYSQRFQWMILSKKCWFWSLSCPILVEYPSKTNVSKTRFFFPGPAVQPVPGSADNGIRIHQTGSADRLSQSISLETKVHSCKTYFICSFLSCFHVWSSPKNKTQLPCLCLTANLVLEILHAPYFAKFHLLPLRNQTLSLRRWRGDTKRCSFVFCFPCWWAFSGCNVSSLTNSWKVDRKTAPAPDCVWVQPEGRAAFVLPCVDHSVYLSKTHI